MARRSGCRPSRARRGVDVELEGTARRGRASEDGGNHHCNPFHSFFFPVLAARAKHAVRSCAPADRNPAPPIKLKRARDRIGPAAGRFEAEECRCEICAANQISPRCHEYRVQSAKKRADADGGVPSVSRKQRFFVRHFVLYSYEQTV